jgi:hypothetical protein
MSLASRLNKSVEEILQLSTLEHELWLGYMLYEDRENRKTMDKAKQQSKARR